MKKNNFLILSIIAGALILRIININQSLWLDEATSANTALNFSYKGILNNFITGDFHPPLYYILLKTWTNIFGNNGFAMRSLSVISGTLLVLMVAKIGTILKNKMVGLTAAIIAATSPLLIYYSQEIRMYSLTALLVAINIYCFLKTKGKNYWWIFFILSSISILYTDYPASTILIIYPLYSLINKYEKKWWIKYILSQLTILLAFIVWLPFLTVQFNNGLNIKGSTWWNKLGLLSIKQLVLIGVKFVTGRITFANKIIYITISFSLLTVYGVLSIIGSLKSKLISLWIIVPLLLITVISSFIPVLQYFRLLFILPALIILISIGLNELPKKTRSMILILVIGANIYFASLYLFNTNFHRENWRDFVNLTHIEAPGSSAIIFPSDSQKEAVNYYKPTVPVLSGVSDKYSYKYLWYVKYVEDIVDPNLNTRKNLEKLGYKQIKEYNFNGVIIIRYENFN